MKLSDSNGAINKKTIKVANYLDLMFFDRQKTKFVTSNNEVIIMFYNKSNDKINHLNVDLKSKNIEIWKYKEIHDYQHQMEDFEEFKFESFKDFKSIISKIISKY